MIRRIALLLDSLRRHPGRAASDRVGHLIEAHALRYALERRPVRPSRVPVLKDLIDRGAYNPVLLEINGNG